MNVFDLLRIIPHKIFKKRRSEPADLRLGYVWGKPRQGRCWGIQSNVPPLECDLAGSFREVSHE